jgi:hypothetical protein
MLLMLWISIHSVRGQDENVIYQQFWLDYAMLYPFQSGIEYTLSTGPRVLVDEENGWRSFEMNNSFFYNLIPWLDLGGGVYWDYTVESNIDKINTFELRPWISARMDFFMNKKVWLRIWTILEQRNLFYLGSKPNTTDYRARFRPEIIYSINRPNFFNDRLVYITFNGEYYRPLSGDPSERFTNLFTVRLGVGFRHTYNWRYHLVFQEQFAKNTIDDPFTSASTIFNIRLLYFPTPKAKRKIKKQADSAH